jgi:hypothetical protein
MATFLSTLTRVFLDDNVVWNTAVYVQDAPLNFDFNLGDPRVLLRCRRFKISDSYPHTCADPFSFAYDGRLYIFYEKVFPGQPGVICALATKDLQHFEDLGEILREPHHLSYPFVFETAEGEVVMIPESSRHGVTSIYGFRDFPWGSYKIRDLLVGDFFDSSAVRVGDRWFLFTTSPEGLHIFHTDSLLHGELGPHPLNPITKDLRYSRCGGAPLRIGEQIYRVAQDCSDSYGRNINVFEINELSTTDYKESLLKEGAMDLTPRWRRLGSHHLSVSSFLGKTVVCVDGKEPDIYINRVFSAFSRLMRR